VPGSAQTVEYHRTPTKGARRRPVDRDIELEQQIEAEYQLMIHASTTQASTAACHRMTMLIHRRSGAQIAKMERAKGLV
jgi:hypothetical protein